MFELGYKMEKREVYVDMRNIEVVELLEFDYQLYMKRWKN